MSAHNCFQQFANASSLPNPSNKNSLLQQLLNNLHCHLLELSTLEFLTLIQMEQWFKIWIVAPCRNS